MQTEILDLLSKLVELGFRFSLIHNPNEKKICIVSATNCDKIKHTFPDWNIYLSGNDKIVERVFFY